jgi:zona occludens toxin
MTEPYAGKGMHLTGMMRMGAKVMYTFAVSNGGTVIGQVTDSDLVRAGYSWSPLTDCAGYLRYGGASKAITCDAPRAQAGTDERPLVMNSGYGSDGRVPARPAGASGQAPAMTAM